jgi:hypothetical protein
MTQSAKNYGLNLVQRIGLMIAPSNLLCYYPSSRLEITAHGFEKGKPAMAYLLSRTSFVSSGNTEQAPPAQEVNGVEELEIWQPAPTPLSPVIPSPRRKLITFTVIALLLIVFSFIAFWGLTHSDWLYGTYGQISQAQWDQIADLRDRLLRFGVAPGAVTALDDALLLPHPSTQEVLFDLRHAALSLDRLKAHATARQIQAELHALITQIEPGYLSTSTPWPTLTPAPTPTLTPMMDAPVARYNEESLCL